MYEVGLNEPVLFFFYAKRNNKKHGRACTVVWVQTCLSLFLPLVYLISSENNSIFRLEKTTF